MNTPTRTNIAANLTVTQLRLGGIYRAVTRNRTEIGEYLGLETSWGDRAILLRTAGGTSSVLVDRIERLVSAAA